METWNIVINMATFNTWQVGLNRKEFHSNSKQCGIYTIVFPSQVFARGGVNLF